MLTTSSLSKVTKTAAAVAKQSAPAEAGPAAVDVGETSKPLEDKSSNGESTALGPPPQVMLGNSKAPIPFIRPRPKSLYAPG